MAEKWENYGSGGASGLSAPLQNVMGQLGNEVQMDKKLALIELMGLEGKNQYEYRVGANGVRGKGKVVAFTSEKSSCFERIICGPGREGEFTVHEGGKDGPTAMNIKKDQYIICCFCCSRPHSRVVDGNGVALGEINDPFHFCSMENIVVDSASGQPWYKVVGSCCTLGMCCPCCADLDFDINDADTGKTVGWMRRKQMTAMECMCPSMNTWTITFPDDADEKAKALLCATQHMLDVNYMDPPRNQSSG